MIGGWEDVREEIKAKAISADIGFTRARVTVAQPSHRIKAYKDWVEAGKHGDMAWVDPFELVMRFTQLYSL